MPCAKSVVPNVGIGTTAATYLLQLSTDSAAKPGTSSWAIASDVRLKDVRGPFIRSLDALDGLHPIYFKYKKDNPLQLPSNSEYVGIKAQDAQAVIPESVHVDEMGYLHLSTDAIFWTMVNALKELKSKVQNGHAEQSQAIATLQAENQLLHAENAAIKAYLCSKDASAAICN